MRILWLNWRDIKNPAAGGAEVVTHQVARRWVAQGHSVTLFAASFPSAAPEETVDGVHIVRRGRQFSVHFHAWRYYTRLAHDSVDLVVDEINTIPFFTPLYAREKRVVYFHQLARQVWLYESRFPLSVLGYWLEPLYLRPYRDTPAVVVSESTRRDLLALGFRRVTVVHDGVDAVPLAGVPPESAKAARPTVAYVGRLVPSKRVADILEAVHRVHAKLPDVQLWLMGEGPRRYTRLLQERVARGGLGDNVRFWGRVSHEQKLDLLKQAHVLAMASVREGWGLVVIEANAMGTPAVVYNVPGLCDSVCHDETGLVCAANTPDALAGQLERILTDARLRDRLARAALERSRTFTWDKNANEFMRAVSDSTGARTL